VREFFDQLAGEWVLRSTAERRLVVEDALDRGGSRLKGEVLEVGAGSGLISPLLMRRVSSLISVDLSLEMLREINQPQGPLVRADASALPFPDGRFDVVAAVNMFLFAEEYARVLRPDGVLLWISTLGEATPIYLHPEEVASRLGEGFDGIWSDAGGGRWAMLWRRNVDLS
jgi:ubiquinone/menaquinone biosynthesis C-methylase UbiE